MLQTDKMQKNPKKGIDKTDFIYYNIIQLVIANSIF